MRHEPPGKGWHDEVPTGLVAFCPSAADAHVGDDLAVVPYQVVGQTRLQSQQELSALDDLPRLISSWTAAGEPAVLPRDGRLSPSRLARSL